MITSSSHQYRPSRLWKLLDTDRRLAAAVEFWRESDAAAQAQAIDLIARHLNFRHKTVVGLADDRKARHLLTIATLPDSLAARLLIVHHLAHARPMMAAFLDLLGIAHDQGFITAEKVTPPEPARVIKAARDLAGRFPPDDVALYLATLVSQDEETWKALKTDD